MAKKFEIIDNALVISDTDSGAVIAEYPKNDVYYRTKDLSDKDSIQIYDTSAVNSLASGLIKCPLASAVDSTLTPFTEATWRDFARTNLGKADGGSGSGTGWDGQVDLYSSLPVTIGVPAIGSVYLVEQPTKILFGTYTTKQSGLYIKDLDTGSLTDWRKLNVKVNFTDSEFAIVSAADNSKRATFDLSLLTTATTRNYVWQNQDGTIALLTDIVNIFNSDGTLTGNRTVNGNSLNLIFDAIATEQHNVSNFNVVTTTAFSLIGSGTSSIETTGAGDLNLLTSGSGKVRIQGIAHPKFDGTLDQALLTNGLGQLLFKSVALLGDDGQLELPGGFSFGDAVTIDINADTNNLAIPNPSTVVLVRLNVTGNYKITGVTPTDPTKAVWLIFSNVGTGGLSWQNNDIGSAPNARMLIGGTVLTQADEGLTLVYDPISLRHRSFGKNI